MTVFNIFQASAQQWKKYSDSAAILKNQRSYSSSIAYYQKAKHLLYSENKLSDEYAQICTALGLVYNTTGDAENAALLFLEAKNTTEQLHTKMDKGYARVTTFLANIYTNLHRFQEAEKLFIEAKDIREKLFGKISEEYAQSCNNLGNLYRTNGDFEKAEPLCVEAKDIRGKVHGKKHPTYAVSAINLANLYRDMGQYGKAEQLYIEAKQIREDTLTKNDPLYAASCNILADLYSNMGRYEQAEKLYIEAKDLRERIFGTKVNADYAQSCNNLANLYVSMGRYKEAEALALQASSIWKEQLPAEHESHANGFSALGTIYFHLKDFAKAEAYFTKARIIWQQTLAKAHGNLINNSLDLAKVYWNQNKTLKASEFFRQAVEAQTQQITNFFSFTNEREKKSFLDNVLSSADEFYSFSLTNKKTSTAGLAYNLSLLKRNLILNSLQQLINVVGREENGQTQILYSQWRNIKTEIAQQAANRTNDDALVKRLEEEAARLEKELVKQSASFKQQYAQSETNYAAIQKRLKPGEAAIEFIEFTYFNGRRWTDSSYYCAMLLRSGSAKPVMIKLFEKKQLEKIFAQAGGEVSSENIKSLYKSRGTEVDNVKNGVSASLYQLVSKPLLKHLKGIHTVYFAPAGLLHRVSFATLPINRSEVLSDRFRLVQLNTTAAIDEEKHSLTATDRLLLYGGIDYSADSVQLRESIAASYVAKQEITLPKDIVRGENWDFLPGTMQEVSGIKSLSKQKSVDAVILQGSNATEESIKMIEGKSSPAVLHIATHGFFFSPPETDQAAKAEDNFFTTSADPLFRSGLLLAGANNTWQNKAVQGIEDGVLTAYEVSNLYLPNTKLVVLSACETALGDIQGTEGVYGLQRAFKMAGVKYLLMSLWKVPDVETAEFMQVFYKNLFSSQSIDKAFYNAQTSMKKKYRKHPFKWAAWILVK